MSEIRKEQDLSEKSLKKLVREITSTYPIEEGYGVVLGLGERWININGLKLYYTPSPNAGVDVSLDVCINCKHLGIHHDPHSIFAIQMRDKNDMQYMVMECRKSITVSAVKLEYFEEYTKAS